jgi:hypothetical protein
MSLVHCRLGAYPLKKGSLHDDEETPPIRHAATSSMTMGCDEVRTRSIRVTLVEPVGEAGDIRFRADPCRPKASPAGSVRDDRHFLP